MPALPCQLKTSLINGHEPYAELLLALVYGSVAKGKASLESDLYIALDFVNPLIAVQKLQIMQQLCSVIQCPIDLTDLCTLGQPLLGEVLQNGIINTELAHSLRQAVGFRNLAVQNYGEIDLAILHLVAQTTNVQYTEFTKALHYSCAKFSDVEKNGFET